MRTSPELSRVAVSFDDPNLVSHAGLLPAASWWQRLGMPGVVARGLRLPGSVGANSDAKVATVVMGMLAGADSIDDLGVLRAGATGRLLGAAKAPSTIGTWLRSFTYRHLRQLELLVRADSGFSDSRFIACCRRGGARFSVTARIDTAVTRAIATIGDDAWVPIPYWDAVDDDDTIIVASSAEVAETVDTAVTPTKAPVSARLLVRRVRRLREAATGEPLDQQDLPVAVSTARCSPTGSSRSSTWNGSTAPTPWSSRAAPTRAGPVGAPAVRGLLGPYSHPTASRRVGSPGRPGSPWPR